MIDIIMHVPILYLKILKEMKISNENIFNLVNRITNLYKL